MEQSITELQELKNRHRHAGIESKERKETGTAAAEIKERPSQQHLPLPRCQFKHIIPKESHSLMAPVAGSPRQGPVTASPDWNMAEFSKKWFALGFVQGRRCRHERIPSAKFIPSDGYKSDEEQVHSA